MYLWGMYSLWYWAISLGAPKSTSGHSAVILYTSLSAVVEDMKIRTVPDSPADTGNKLFVFTWLCKIAISYVQARLNI